ncbi:MAG: limonene-1,2-epoxide hydrolase family protein [Acidimicrobiales bacterium]|nr:limonene-1,2-epoxide hydrolase family protein [Acidimicrobiales bacterium]
MADTTVQTDMDVVRAFLGALGRLDIDAAAHHLHDAVVYQNVPLRPARGRPMVEKQLQWMGRYGSAFEARIHNIAAAHGVVLTERTDVLGLGRMRASFWVCGTFEVQDGKIILWRDYFDYVDVAVAFVKGAVRAVIGRNP